MHRPRLLKDNSQTNIPPSGLGPELYGETPYLERIEHYATQALLRREKGADRIVLPRMPGLAEARAAVLGARASGLPVYVSLALEREGRRMEAPGALAALLCLQELGIAGFGFDFHAVDRELLELYTRIAPYGKVPLTARPAVADGAEPFAALLRAGAELLFLGGEDEAIYAFAAEAVEKTAPTARPPRREDAPLLLCGETEVYYLEEDFTLSEEIPCSYDMSETILEREREGCDALQYHVVTVEDAGNLGRNIHLARCAACFLAESEEALEMALALYNGRALVDARSDVEDAPMKLLADAYGAIIR